MDKEQWRTKRNRYNPQKPARVKRQLGSVWVLCGCFHKQNWNHLAFFFSYYGSLENLRGNLLVRRPFLHTGRRGHQASVCAPFLYIQDGSSKQFKLDSLVFAQQEVAVASSGHRPSTELTFRQYEKPSPVSWPSPSQCSLRHTTLRLDHSMWIRVEGRCVAEGSGNFKSKVHF